MAEKYKKILVMENKSSALQMLIAYLIGEGFRVFKVKDENKGLEIISKKRPDLVLLDIFEPAMDGMATLKKLRANSLGKDIPVIVLANLGDIKTIAEALENKVYTFLVKSDWDFEGIIKKIQERLKTEELP